MCPPNNSAMIAGAFGLCFVGVYAFMMGNPQKAQDVAGKVSSDVAARLKEALMLDNCGPVSTAALTGQLAQSSSVRAARTLLGVTRKASSS